MLLLLIRDKDLYKYHSNTFHRFSLQIAVMKLVCVLLFALVIFCQKTLGDELNSGQAIRIITTNDHVFNLELDGIKSILENDSIKDRSVVVVSIAGAFRQGKSFLLNFFIKYLFAQVSQKTTRYLVMLFEMRNKLNCFYYSITVQEA